MRFLPNPIAEWDRNKSFMIKLLDVILDKLDGLEINIHQEKHKSFVGDNDKHLWWKASLKIKASFSKKGLGKWIKNHKRGTLLMETISWKRVLITHCIDQFEAVDPWQEPRIGGNQRWFNVGWWCSALQVVSSSKLVGFTCMGSFVCWSLTLYVIKSFRLVV